MEIYIQIAGVLLILLAFIHVIFPWYFEWEKDLKPLSLINREMMKTHTFFIAITVLFMGILCWTSYHEMTRTNLGQTIALGLSIFWGLRLFIQLFGYSSELWKGKIFETTAHVLFTMLWIFLSIVFFLCYYL